MTGMRDFFFLGIRPHLAGSLEHGKQWRRSAVPCRLMDVKSAEPAGIDLNPEDRLKGGSKVTASQLPRDMKEVRLSGRRRHTANQNHRGPGGKALHEKSKL